MNRLDQLLAFHLEDPNDSFIRFALAAEYRKLGQLEKALKSFEDLMAKDPDY
ncbi:MAG TPA: tetratricopeptide repeat protein, partial [Bacteroidetes bacterium]|nr:tetratricopeptide repeat protein [Bacteroidota bacterium]